MAGLNSLFYRYETPWHGPCNEQVSFDPPSKIEFHHEAFHPDVFSPRITSDDRRRDHRQIGRVSRPADQD